MNVPSHSALAFYAKWLRASHQICDIALIQDFSARILPRWRLKFIGILLTISFDANVAGLLGETLLLL